MTDRTGEDGWDSTGGSGDAPEPRDGAETVEAYEIEDGIVLYDAENPLAWVEASSAVRLHEQA